MLHNHHYTNWIDPEHERPVLSTRTGSWLGDWAWLILPVVVLALALVIH